MEKSEPTLVPEWLRSTGSVSGGSSSTHHSAISSPLSDVSSSTHHMRNRNSKSVGDFDSPRSAFLDRTSSSNARRSSSNGSAKHAYISFSRGHHSKDRERDKERSSFGDQWDEDSSDPLGTILTGRNEKDALWRSFSMVSRKQSDVLPRRLGVDLKNESSNQHTNGNGSISVGATSSSIQKAVFEKDFPSLGIEEKQAVPDIGRVSSPGLSAVQNLPIASPTLIGSEGWSALADVPTVIGSGSTVSLSAAHSIAAFPSGAPGAGAGLNMAEALTQAPSKTRAVPQLSVQTQRLEELAIKQSRQLIPVTPSMLKSSVLGSSDKSKPKTGVRSGEMNMTAKSMQQQPSSLHTGNQSLLGGHAKSDVLKTSHGKLFVLKPGWENGVTPASKDSASPTNSVSRVANGQLAATAVPSAPPKSPNNPKHTFGDRKSASLNLVPGFNLEKKPTLSQTQSRNDFFNLLKKKTSVNTSPVISDSASAVSSPTCEKPCEVYKGDANAPASQAIKNGAEVTINGPNYEEFQRFSEEEVVFLRSLGWDENSGEGGLTEEEINAFYQKYMKLKPPPPLKVCQGVQQKLLESHATSSGGVSSESSDSGSTI
uniref:Mediator of RNA polymerase II transcription subunit 1 isoform X2 n=1 Tax=Rhizophora mucronata TaxID=61149 RepID=A0A2P2KHH6_RHIMU